MAAAVEGQIDQAPSEEAQLAVATTETGWVEARAGYDELRDHLRPVASLIHVSLHPSPESGETAEATSDIAAAFDAFEAWYRERFRQHFLDLLGREAPSLHPVVDF